MPQTIVSAMGGPLDGEVFDMQKCRTGGLLLRWAIAEDRFHGMPRRFIVVDSGGPCVTPYIWDGKRLSYERA